MKNQKKIKLNEDELNELSPESLEGVSGGLAAGGSGRIWAFPWGIPNPWGGSGGFPGGGSFPGLPGGGGFPNGVPGL